MQNLLNEFTEIENYLVHAPHVKELGKNPYPKDTYAAYAKIVLKSGDTLTTEVDKRIVAAMQHDGIEIRHIVKALTFSPNFKNMSENEILEFFLLMVVSPKVSDRYRVENYLAKIFEVEDLKELSYPQSVYVEYAKDLLAAGETITEKLDRQIIQLMNKDITIPFLLIVEVMAASPNYKHMKISEVRKKVEEVLYKKRRMYIAIALVLIGIGLQPWWGMMIVILGIVVGIYSISH
ncbi:hypothetical protein [Sporomusa sphaeroides]|uniref:Uncharacterized protein n=1 Tax=Sporomusa sphaeroides DSM 2875 TaxID=1337886 RepID=A0A1U7MA70_9FIRM|nr:hypothetical protein [Sporomusa sphaeroides]OLS54325.1 hypothetical protein SPSPH_45710 [Sporomusa sphaeroides DSM 2875]CVK21554.1 hypothetical protein SSPH_04246 [Sporomusa sphaeroides DSM 2875]